MELATQFSQPTKPTASQKNTHSIEFFHVYTDEEIGIAQTRSLEFLQEAKNVWNLQASTVVMIDNYNPTEHTLSVDDVMAYLDKEGCKPDYWAFEADLVKNAETLMANLTNDHLARNYRSYIVKHDKYPCSLLTATWYLTRLGVFDPNGVIRQGAASEPYEPTQYLLNILPEVYKPIEKRAHELIDKSRYMAKADYIQALFYPAEISRKLELF